MSALLAKLDGDRVHNISKLRYTGFIDCVNVVDASDVRFCGFR